MPDIGRLSLENIAVPPYCYIAGQAGRIRFRVLFPHEPGIEIVAYVREYRCAWTQRPYGFKREIKIVVVARWAIGRRVRAIQHQHV